jgi:hypothetical protein
VPGSIAIGDFNNDGKTDLVVTTGSTPSGGGYNVSALIGNGDSTFQKQLILIAARRPPPSLSVILTATANSMLRSARRRRPR